MMKVLHHKITYKVSLFQHHAVQYWDLFQSDAVHYYLCLLKSLWQRNVSSCVIPYHHIFHSTNGPGKTKIETIISLHTTGGSYLNRTILSGFKTTPTLCIKHVCRIQMLALFWLVESTQYKSQLIQMTKKHKLFNNTLVLVPQTIDFKSDP